MDSSLVQGSLEGNTHAIYVSIRENPHVLEDIDREPFAVTPMHVAAVNGHTPFVLEIMRLKPSLAKKLNQEGFSPIHLALINGHSQMAISMVEMDRELVRVKGRDGVTPLHYVAEHGDPQLLELLVSACRTSLQDVTSRNQTALHFAIMNQLKAVECVQVLLEGYKKFSQFGKYLNCKDSNGDTPLHIATFTSQTMIVKALIDGNVIDMNATNINGLTALNMSERLGGGGEEIRAMLHNAANTTSYPALGDLDTFLSSEERLESVAKTGNIDFLYSIIKEDPHVLDRIDAIPFVDTPLHIATSVGHIQFALEIMRLKPSFSRKLNPRGFNPLHLALHNGKFDMASRLVEADIELVRAQGKHGETALHFAARHGNLGLLKQFLSACPLSILDVTIKRETVLHIAVQNNRSEAFKFLVWKLRTAVHKDSHNQENEILSKRDENFDTPLDIAGRTNQPQEYLRNSQGLTPNVLQTETPENALSRNESRRIVLDTGAPNTTSLVTTDARNVSSNPTFPDIEGLPLQSNNPSDYVSVEISKLDHWIISICRSRSSLSSDLRSNLLVVMVLIATAGYQAAQSPPAGLWQDNIYSDVKNNTSDHKSPTHRAGTSIMKTQDFFAFELFNTVTLFIALVVIFFLFPGAYINKALFVPLFLFFYCYGMGLVAISPNLSISYCFTAVCILFLVLFFILTLSFKRAARRLNFKL